jgi:ADP-ribose pyrophosphatase YjhB (NUDIX family)
MCGTAYPKNQPDPYAQTCHQCHYTYHENPRTATGAIIIQNNQLLLVKRARDPRKNFWDVPGGFTQPNENPEASLKREVKEELGVGCTIGKLLGAYGPNPYPYLGKLNYTCDLFYLVAVTSNQFKPQDDVAGYRWFPLTQLPPNKDIAFPSLRTLLHNLYPKQTKPRNPLQTS